MDRVRLVKGCPLPGAPPPGADTLSGVPPSAPLQQRPRRTGPALLPSRSVRPPPSCWCAMPPAAVGRHCPRGTDGAAQPPLGLRRRGLRLPRRCGRSLGRGPEAEAICAGRTDAGASVLLGFESGGLAYWVAVAPRDLRGGRPPPGPASRTAPTFLAGTRRKKRASPANVSPSTRARAAFSTSAATSSCASGRRHPLLRPLDHAPGRTAPLRHALLRRRGARRVRWRPTMPGRPSPRPGSHRTEPWPATAQVRSRSSSRPSAISRRSAGSPPVPSSWRRPKRRRARSLPLSPGWSPMATACESCCPVIPPTSAAPCPTPTMAARPATSTRRCARSPCGPTRKAPTPHPARGRRRIVTRPAVIPAVPDFGIGPAPEPGRLDEVAPGVRRLTAPNPGLMTGPGPTRIWSGALVGAGRRAGCRRSWAGRSGPHRSHRGRRRSTGADPHHCGHPHPRDHAPGAAALAAGDRSPGGRLWTRRGFRPRRACRGGLGALLPGWERCPGP